MRRWLFWPALALCAVWLATCETAPPPPPDDHGPRNRLVKVASNGWHTAIIGPASAIAAIGLLPESADFPDAAYGRSQGLPRIGGAFGVDVLGDDQGVVHDQADHEKERGDGHHVDGEAQRGDQRQ